MPLLKNASAQWMGQLCTPCPSAYQLGHHFRALGWLGGGSRTQLQPQDSQRCQRQSQAGWAHSHLCWKDSPSPGRATPSTAYSRARNLAWSREERKFFNSVTDLENVSVHPRHSWGLFLPVAEGNASVLPQARMGHSTCTHRYRASPTSQVFHSNTGQ